MSEGERGGAVGTGGLLRGSLVQGLRLGAGLVLLAFAATHFLNHAAGLFGLEAMEAGQTLRFAVTRSTVGSLVLAAAVVVHIGLGLARLAERRTLRMPPWEAAQIATGLFIPILLIDHIAHTRGAAMAFGANDYYRPVLAALWPDHAVRQSLLVVLVWGHGMIGLHHWLKLAPWYARWRPGLVLVAVLLPTLALAGFIAGGREVAAGLAADGGRAAVLAAHGYPSAETSMMRIGEIGLTLTLGYLAAVGAVVVIIGLRAQADRRRPMVAIGYSNGPEVTGPIGATLLEISRLGGVPHAAVCGGRARCSTCRVRIDAGGSSLTPPGFAEAATLGAIRAPAGVRLACQIRPHAPMTVTRLVMPEAVPATLFGAPLEDASGVERQLAVMFLDLKGFTALSEQKLPYDVVFLLNRFFGAIGLAIATEGGWIDKYMGDGLLAVFGRETGLQAGARAALAAAARIDVALEALNRDLEAEGTGTIGVGIGIHAGPLVVGRIGYAETAQVTVIGATVNLASRLEGLTRDRGCQMVVSRALADAAGWDGGRSIAEQAMVRGQSAPVEILIVDRARDVAVAGATPRQA